ncbi:hypothetical protein DFQ27_003020 [Actinomortierella ambigua]|uniref:Uncharacterized protein n=1 Tax=Actinomortierella ambigua TaxID=1343610 RepID=A0A9P6QI91_9FUNG|nr:hypothetical protein DFQ27_003020 [Actinomortierella ambigua]
MARFSDLFITNHHKLEDSYNRLLTSKNSDERGRRQNEFVWGMARLLIAEELIYYPTLEKIDSFNAGLTTRSQDKGQSMIPYILYQQQVKSLLISFHDIPPTHPDFESLARKIWNMYSAHLEEQESGDLRILEQNLSQEESANLAKAFERTRYLIPMTYCCCYCPSCAHSTDQPLDQHPQEAHQHHDQHHHQLQKEQQQQQRPLAFDTASSLLRAPVSKIRDALRQFPQEE